LARATTNPFYPCSLDWPVFHLDCFHVPDQPTILVHLYLTGSSLSIVTEFRPIQKIISRFNFYKSLLSCLTCEFDPCVDSTINHTTPSFASVGCSPDCIRTNSFLICSFYISSMQNWLISIPEHHRHPVSLLMTAWPGAVKMF
jgi:hypothetical protein